MKKLFLLLITSLLLVASACEPPRTYDGAALDAGKKAMDKLEDARESATENQNALDDQYDELFD